MLILFHHAATNHKLDGNNVISAVVHFLIFAGILPVIFGNFSPSSHFCQAENRKQNKTEVICENDGHDGS